MSLFNQSTIPWVTAVQRIADSIGASADNEMTNRAHASLRAAFQHFGGKARWDFLRAELTPQAVVAPFGLTGVSASAGQASAACPAGHGLKVEDVVVGDAFGVGTRISATAASGFSIYGTTVLTAAGVSAFSITAIRDEYDAPSDQRNGYGVKLLSSQRPLRYVGRRAWDRAVYNEFQADTVQGYDLFPLGAKSKIRLLPPPSTADVLLQRYYRRFTMASASGVSANLDIPEDYEEYPIAWAKWHFLTDKGEGRKAQGQTWLSLAQDGIKTMLAEQTQIPDESLGFSPGHIPDERGDRSTYWINWNYS